MNLRVRYRVHKRPPPAPILNQMNPLYIFPPYFSKTHSDIILSFTARSSAWSLPCGFSNQTRIFKNGRVTSIITPFPNAFQQWRLTWNYSYTILFWLFLLVFARNA